uniref:Syntaxin-2-like n=1 Tax=Sinocyclocheilus rhinocerous TaxID=307959 RepID=A0A673H578_9TELE
NAFLEKFIPKVNEVQQLIERISFCVEEVKLRHSTILTEINPPNYVREELEQFSSDIKHTADVIKVKLKGGQVVTEEETEVLLQSNNPAVFTSNINSGSCITGQALNEIELRHKDILYLEASIRELHSMFMDIATLVNSQGEMANNIAKTVMQAGNYVDQGKENIEKATDYKKSWRLRLPIFKSKAKPATSKGS